MKSDLPAGSLKTKDYLLYRSGLPIDGARPWQLITSIGCVVGKFCTREDGVPAIEALQVDHDAGALPCDLSAWDKHHLLVSS